MPRQAIEIRKASQKDAALIAALSRLSFTQSFASHNTPENMQKFMDNDFAEARLIAEVENGEGIFIIGHLAGKPMGYARLRQTEEPAGLTAHRHIEIARIYVLQEALGKGLGAALLDSCMDIARSAHAQIIWLGVWEHNRRAIEFYQKWGFVKFGSHIFMLGDDEQTDWLMKKNLGG